MEASEALQELLEAAHEAAEILQLHAQNLEQRGESSSVERIAVMRLNMALLAIEEQLSSV
ncbi:MAG TPA: hypothetical protein VNN09_03965 [Candidatus Competibacteraceae bacterium]|nr:hypothetical protein [Candidatus Competibacteraceae bacterium]